MEEKVSEVLDNILGLLLLEGSYEIEENEGGFFVSIETQDAGRLIGPGGEFLESLQLIVNQIVSQQQKEGEFKRVVLDVGGWRKQKEEDLKKQATDWGKQVLESGQELELEPQSAWQRLVVHTAIGEMEGLQTESIGEGRDRHIVIRKSSEEVKSKSKKKQVKKAAEDTKAEDAS